MSEFTENTEFILTKIDSLVQKALPSIEKGGEMFVRYHALTQVITYIVVLMVAIYLMIIFWKNLTKVDLDVFNREAIVCMLTFFPLLFSAMYSIIELTSFIQAIVAPEIYTIMKVIGQ